MRLVIFLFLLGLSVVSTMKVASAQDEGAYGYEFCQNPTRAAFGGGLGNDSECIASCTKLSNLIDDGTLTLEGAFDSKGFGVCTGSASDIRRTIYKLELAKDGVNLQTSRCTIWLGEMEVSFSGKSVGDVVSSNNRIDVSSCPLGTYDTLFWTISRFTEYSGDTAYLHDPAERARTQSTITSVRNQTLDSATPDEALSPADIYDSGRAGTPNLSGFANIVGQTPVINLNNGTTGNTDFMRETRKFSTEFIYANDAPMSNGLMDFDELSIFEGTTAREGYLCDGSLNYMCVRAIPGRNERMEWLLKSGEDGIISGLPVTIEADTKLNIEIGYFAPRAGEEELGLWYTFYHNAQTGETGAVGAQPGEDGLWVTVSTE